MSRLTSAALITAGVAIGWTVVSGIAIAGFLVRDYIADRRYRAHPNGPGLFLERADDDTAEWSWDDGDLGDVIPMGGGEVA